MLNFFTMLDDMVWGAPLLILLVGTGIYLTVRLGLLQVLKLPKAFKLIFADDKGQGDISSFAEQFTNYSCAHMAGVDSVFAGKDNRWCGVFTDYVLKNSGHYDEAANWYKKLGNKWNPEAIYNAANKAGAVVSASEVRPGDLIVMNWENDNEYDHVGLVVSVNENSVTVMEGNNGNYTRKTEYPINGNVAFLRTR